MVPSLLALLLGLLVLALSSCSTIPPNNEVAREDGGLKNPPVFCISVSERRRVNMERNFETAGVVNVSWVGGKQTFTPQNLHSFLHYADSALLPGEVDVALWHLQIWLQFCNVMRST